MTTYARRPDRDSWHFCTNCSNYPKGRDVIKVNSAKRPSTGELCDQCKAKRRNGDCS